MGIDLLNVINALMKICPFDYKEVEREKK